MKNLVSLFGFPVNDALVSDPTPTRQYDCQVNFTQALAKCKDLIPLLFQRSKRKIRLILDALFAILKKTIEPIRSGRKYPQNHRVASRKYYLNFKPIA
ncbi:MAG: hypothetical protein JRH18_20730 [Deltaproteobacteria bacterium]|nr:hypothetical protein [Deltaproteobacteria bacterium]MBW2154078.1 hypothetical protein [Deltaproteobacteria bacterium]